MADDLLTCAKNAAAVIQAHYQLVDRVLAAGGAKSIEGVAACHAMLNSLQNNRGRTEHLVIRPLQAAIKRAEEL